METSLMFVKEALKSPLAKKVVVGVVVTVVGHFTTNFSKKAYDAAFNSEPTTEDD